MDHTLNGNKVGLALGGFVGVVHIMWALFIALGWAAPLMNFIFGLHFLNNPYQIAPFSFMTAVLLVVIASCVGYVFGRIFALVWNRVCSSR